MNGPFIKSHTWVLDLRKLKLRAELGTVVNTLEPDQWLQETWNSKKGLFTPSLSSILHIYPVLCTSGTLSKTVSLLRWHTQTQKVLRLRFCPNVHVIKIKPSIDDSFPSPSICPTFVPTVTTTFRLGLLSSLPLPAHLRRTTRDVKLPLVYSGSPSVSRFQSIVPSPGYSHLRTPRTLTRTTPPVTTLCRVPSAPESRFTVPKSHVVTRDGKGKGRQPPDATSKSVAGTGIHNRS